MDFEVKTYMAKEKDNPDEKIEKKWVDVLSSLLNLTPISAKCVTNPHFRQFPLPSAQTGTLLVSLFVKSSTPRLRWAPGPRLTSAKAS